MSVIGTTANYIPTSDISSYFPTLDTSLYNDTTLSGIVTRASAKVDNYLGFTLPYESITEKVEGLVDSDGNLNIFANKYPIDTVSTITINKGLVSIALSLTDPSNNNRYDVIPSFQKNQIVYPNSQIVLTGAILIRSFFQLKATRFFTQVTYTAGYQTIPSDIKEAVGLLVADYLAENAYNPMGAVDVSQGGVRYSFPASAQSQREKEAYSLLSRYRRISGF